MAGVNQEVFMRFVFSFLLVLFYSTGITAQTVSPTQTPLITVTGSAEVKVAPDEAVFQLEVETRDKDLRRAKQLNDEKLKALLDAVKSIIADQRMVQAGYVSISPEYDFTKDDRRIFLGYKINRDVSLVLRDLTKFDELLGEIVKAGITKVEDVQLRTTQLRQHKDQARALAVKAAQEKAAAMAKEIGQSIGKAVNITELSESNFQSQALRNTTTMVSGSPSDADSLFQPGLISVKANVMVSFELK
jgi:uncharacterized protein